MKFIWNEPEPTMYEGTNQPAYPKGSFWEEPILGWLKYHNIFFRMTKYNEPRAYELSYNYAYHFFDLYIYEDAKNGGCRPIDQMQKFLVKSTLIWQATPASQLDNRQQPPVRIPGVRFWIDAEDKANPEWKKQ